MRSETGSPFVRLGAVSGEILLERAGWLVPFPLLPGNHFGISALTCMDYEHREKPPTTAEQRAAKKEKNLWDAEQAMKERRKADDAFRANYQRLKAERLAREAANS